MTRSEPRLELYRERMGLMKSLLRKSYVHPRNQLDLYCICPDTWNYLPVIHFHSIVDSMPTRVQSVRAHKGGLRNTKLLFLNKIMRIFVAFAFFRAVQQKHSKLSTALCIFRN